MDVIAMEAIKIFAPVAGTVLTGLVSWGVFEITKFFRTKTKNEAVNDAIDHVCNAVETTVADLNQTMVNGLKQASADGKLSQGEIFKLRELSLHKIQKQIPAAMQKTAEFAVTSFNDFVVSKIEHEVGFQKSYSK